MLKVQLISNTFGPKDLLITDPYDLDVFTETIRRSDNSDGLIYDFTSILGFVKGGREYLKNAKELGQGIEENVVANIFEYNPNTYRWFLAMLGRVNLPTYKITETRVDVNINQIGFNTNFNNLVSQNVQFFNADHFVSKNGTRINVSDSIVQLKLQPKTILKESKMQAPAGNLFQATDPTGVSIDQILYSRLDTSELKIKELDDTFGYTSTIQDTSVPLLALNDYLAKEAGVLTSKASGQFELRVEFDLPLADTAHFIIKLWYRHEDSNGVVYPGEEFVMDTFEFDQLGVHPQEFHVMPIENTIASGNMVVGDKIITYITFQATSKTSGGAYPNYTLVQVKTSTGTYLDFKQATIFPETTCDAVMLYELLERITQNYTNRQNCFRSAVLGRTDTVPSYDVDGEASLVAVTNGWAVRQLTSVLQNVNFRSLFFNFKEVLDAITMIFCVSWGFDTLDDGTPIVRVEKKGHFFDKSLEILDLGEMPKVEKAVEASLFWQTVSFSYPPLKQIKQINAIDEFNTSRIWDNTITQVQGKLEMASTLSASGYEIELQRRQTIASTDSPLDDTKFIVSVLRDGAPVDGVQGWKNRRNEGYTDITNLYSPETAYNLDFRPAKCAARWKPFLACVTTRLNDKTLKFNFGTGNYLVTCTDIADGEPIDERGTIDLSNVTAIYVPEYYSTFGDLTRDQWALVKQRQYGYFKFTDKGVECRGFIKEVPRNHNTKGTKYKLLKVFTF